MKSESAAEPHDGPGDGPPPAAQKALRFPTAFTVLAIVLLAVWVASFIIPSGSYRADPETGGPQPGSYQELPACDVAAEGERCVDKSLKAQFGTLWRATPNGLYGIENADGRVGPDEEGFLYGSAQIFLFVLAVGAFVTVAMTTGAIQTGIGRLAMRFKGSGSALIVVLMLIFAVGGTTYGMWEETLGFFALLVPLSLALGYDRIVAVSIIFFGAGTGVLASTVNPFATGVASDAAGISVGDGIVLRVVLWILLVSAAIAYVLRYAHRVKADPTRSIVGISSQDAADASGLVEDVPLMTGRQRLVLVVFFLAFAIMIYGFIPWDDVVANALDGSWPLPTFTTFYFTEASMLFIVAAVVIGLIARLGEQRTVATIVSGAGDFLGAALIIVLARGITVVMKNTAITDTVLSWTEDAVSGTSSGVFGVLALLLNLPIAFLVPSSSGHAALVMPILAPLADFAGVDRSIAVTSFQSASGLVNYITPTSAIVMGGLTLAKVRYDHYLRFALPFVGLALVITCVFLALGTALS
jgi:uncharacterized ion transporter superfamily protein YfcC